MPLLKIFASLLVFALSPAALAAEFWGPQGYPGFTSGLQPASERTLQRATKNYRTVLQQRAGLDLAKIRVATFKDIDPLLARAAQSGLGTLDLFTQKELADPSAMALLLDGSTLRQIDAKYHLSGAWMISTRTLLPDHRAMNMDYMIVGQSRLIIGYPYEAPVEVMEEGKPLEYRYEPFIEARIVNSGLQRGLFDIKVLSNPAAEFLAFQGPMGAELRSFRLEDNSVVVNYRLGVDQQVHTDKTPIVIKPTHLAQSL